MRNEESLAHNPAIYCIAITNVSSTMRFASLFFIAALLVVDAYAQLRNQANEVPKVDRTRHLMAPCIDCTSKGGGAP